MERETRAGLRGQTRRTSCMDASFSDLAQNSELPPHPYVQGWGERAMRCHPAMPYVSLSPCRIRPGALR